MNADDKPAVNDIMPGWEAINRDYIESGVPGLLMIRVMPRAVLYVDSNALRIGARFATSNAEPPPLSPLAAISVCNVIDEGVQCIEVSTSTFELFRNFYFFLLDVIAEILDHGADPRAALAASLSRWHSLLRESIILTDEQQTGLYGELWVLRRLIDGLGPNAIKAWTGPTKQPHDFRLTNIEIEVKTTTGVRRTHTVNGLAQLMPSPGCSLFIASLRIEDAGSGGETLPDVVASIYFRLAGSEDIKALFSAGLTAVGYRDADVNYYSRRRRRPADAVIIVPVEDGCPRLTTESFEKLPARYAPERILDVTYKVDLSGLGFVDGSTEFLRILPAPAMRIPGDPV